jgi:4-hydroxy-3-methylbut-2-enyl diphosphate reductase
MDVVLAKNAGACYGVQRALDLANSAIENSKSVATLGPLIHNPAVVFDLESKGLSQIDKANQAKAGQSIVIRSHGVEPATLRELEQIGCNIIDATCPHVMRAQKAAEAFGKSKKCVLVVGEAGHPEVEGIVAYALETGARAYVVSSPKDIPSDLVADVGVVVQTTQRASALKAVVDELHSRGIEASVKDTICSATAERQSAAEQLSTQVEVMVVIGGRNSSNTTRLAEICKQNCKTLHIEQANELKDFDFSLYARVGVTAGASTPEDQIQDVLNYLNSL